MEQPSEKGKRWVISTKDEMRQAVIDVAREAEEDLTPPRAEQHHLWGWGGGAQGLGLGDVWP